MSKHILPLRNGEDKRLVREWVDRAPTGKGWRVQFMPPVRSTDANKLMWALLDEVAAQVEWAGKKRTSDEWKALFSASLRALEFVPNLDGDGFVAFGARTSEFSPEEMSDMIELIISWGTQRGVVFTDQQNTASGGERASAPTGNGADADAREQLGAKK